jgi:uncharacterized protein Ymh
MTTEQRLTTRLAKRPSEDNFVERKPQSVKGHELRQTLVAFSNSLPEKETAVLFIGGWFLVSRQAKKITSRNDFGSYLKAGLLPKAQLHPLIASKVYPAFMRGEYDTAVFQAFREVEVAVRAGGNFGPNDYGTELMRDAFKPAEKKGQVATPGPLTDTQ